MTKNIPYTRCAVEGCKRKAIDGLPYCPEHDKQFAQEARAAGVDTIRIPGWQYRQAAGERKRNASVRVEDMAPGGKLEFWRRRLRKAG